MMGAKIEIETEKGISRLKCKRCGEVVVNDTPARTSDIGSEYETFKCSCTTMKIHRDIVNDWLSTKLGRKEPTPTKASEKVRQDIKEELKKTEWVIE